MIFQNVLPKENFYPKWNERPEKRQNCTSCFCCFYAALQWKKCDDFPTTLWLATGLRGRIRVRHNDKGEKCCQKSKSCSGIKRENEPKTVPKSTKKIQIHQRIFNDRYKKSQYAEYISCFKMNEQTDRGTDRRTDGRKRYCIRHMPLSNLVSGSGIHTEGFWYLYREGINWAKIWQQFYPRSIE